MDKVKSTKIKQHIRHVASGYAFPGGYPLYIAMRDGSAICPTCVRKMYRTLYRDSVTGYGPSFEVDSAQVNWEDNTLFCDNCGKWIEPAYSDD
jgi:hypothetical protein